MITNATTDDELYNKLAEGGMGLLDVRRNADSLLLKQMTTMLLKDKEGAYRHLSYWLGTHLCRYLLYVDIVRPCQYI